MIGQLDRVYEVLNRTRPLTLKMVWRLHRELGIPAESLSSRTSAAKRRSERNVAVHEAISR